MLCFLIWRLTHEDGSDCKTSEGIRLWVLFCGKFRKYHKEIVREEGRERSRWNFTCDFTLIYILYVYEEAYIIYIIFKVKNEKRLHIWHAAFKTYDPSTIKIYQDNSIVCILPANRVCWKYHMHQHLLHPAARKTSFWQPGQNLKWNTF